jgi:hypothetical protein
MNNASRADCKNQELVCLLLGFLVFFASLVLSGFYTEADQANYHSAYSILPGMGWEAGQLAYQSRISGAEGVHYLVSLVGSTLEIDKDLLMSVCNGILAAYSMRLFLAWGADIRIAAAIVATNFYVFVLYFAAERLKFGFLFLVLALLSTGKPVRMFIFSFMSIWSHFSMFLVCLGAWFSDLFAKARNGELPPRSIWLKFALPAALIALGVGFKSNYLLWKLNTYFVGRESFNFTSLAPVLILLGFSCFYAKRFIGPVLSFLPVMIGIAILGGSRLNMLGYFIFLYYGLRTNGGLNVGVLATLVYLAYKALGLVSNIIVHGHGFP